MYARMLCGLLGLAATLAAAGPLHAQYGYQSSTSKLTSRFETPKVYDVYYAQPTEMQYALEVRYLETSTQEGSDWFIFTTSSTKAGLDSSIYWVAIHLAAEWRVVPYWPEPNWILYRTYDTSYRAKSVAAWIESLGFLAKVRERSIFLSP